MHIAGRNFVMRRTSSTDYINALSEVASVNLPTKMECGTRSFYAGARDDQNSHDQRCHKYLGSVDSRQKCASGTRKWTLSSWSRWKLGETTSWSQGVSIHGNRQDHANETTRTGPCTILHDRQMWGTFARSYSLFEVVFVHLSAKIKWGTRRILKREPDSDRSSCD